MTMMKISRWLALIVERVERVGKIEENLRSDQSDGKALPTPSVVEPGKRVDKDR